MSDSLPLGFIHRCIYNTYPKNEWLPIHVCVQLSVENLCMLSERVWFPPMLRPSRRQELMDGETFSLTSLRSGFTLRWSAWFLTLHCFCRCRRIRHSHRFTLRTLSVCTCVHYCVPVCLLVQVWESEPHMSEIGRKGRENVLSCYWSIRLDVDAFRLSVKWVITFPRERVAENTK